MTLMVYYKTEKSILTPTHKKIKNKKDKKSLKSKNKYTITNEKTRTEYNISTLSCVFCAIRMLLWKSRLNELTSIH